MSNHPDPEPIPGLPQPPRRLSREISDLLTELREGPITLREIVSVIHGRAYTLLLILLSLPFCLPVPLPGLSTAFGVVVTIIGLRLSLRLDPWLPDTLLDASFASDKIVRVLNASRWVASRFEVLLKPRWSFLVDWVLLHHLYGAMICICGLLLLLPLPVPLSNMFPAVTVIFLSAALLERDGYFVVAGIVMFALTLVFFAAIYFGGVAALDWIREWFRTVFPTSMA